MGPQEVPRAEWVGEHQAVSWSSDPVEAASLSGYHGGNRDFTQTLTKTIFKKLTLK